MSISSSHLTSMARAAQSGAHVVLRGHLGDEVLLEGRLVTEDWAIQSVLEEDVGIEIVMVADLADGLRCADPDHEGVVSELLLEFGTDGAALGVKGSLETAAAARALLVQDRVPIAVVLRDPGLMFALDTEQGRLAIGALRDALDEAAYHGAGTPSPTRNVLVAKGVPSNHCVDILASVPGVVEVHATLPDRSERRTVLELLRDRFFQSEGSGADVQRGLDSLARATHNYSIRELEHMRRRSHVLEIPMSRPESLYRSSRGERGRTPIDRVGVEIIMQMLEDQIAGQPAALESIRRILSRGRSRSYDRVPGSFDHRPLASMLLHGAPGVGKTETGLILAEALCGTREAVVRIDCSEYQSSHDIARLVGAPPGFVGYESGGVLTEPLTRDVTVIVFDEFDRASGKLEELLLGVFDAGRLTDGRGQTGSFRNAIVILTTNKSMDSLKRTTASGPPPTDEFLMLSADSIDEALRVGPKEGGIGSGAFHSRLGDSLVGYDFLRAGTVGKIVEKSCRNMASNIADELDLTVSFHVEAFVEAISKILGPAGEWDGRRARIVIGDVIEIPVHEQIEAASFSPGSSVRAYPGEGGLAAIELEPA